MALVGVCCSPRARSGTWALSSERQGHFPLRIPDSLQRFAPTVPFRTCAVLYPLPNTRRDPPSPFHSRHTLSRFDPAKEPREAEGQARMETSRSTTLAAWLILSQSPRSCARIMFPSPLLIHPRSIASVVLLSHEDAGACNLAFPLPLRDSKRAFFGGKTHGRRFKIAAASQDQSRPHWSAQQAGPFARSGRPITLGTNQDAGLRVNRSQGTSDLALCCWAVRPGGPLNSDVIGLQGRLARIHIHRCTDPRHLTKDEQELSRDGRQQHSRQ